MHTILYPINKLVIGGAEQQLLELVRGIDKESFHPIVAPLYPGGGLEDEFRAVPGVEYIDLNRAGKFDPTPLWTVTRLLRSRRIDIVQPFLSPATFFGLLPALTRPSTITIVTERCGIRRSRGIGYKLYRTIEDWFSHLADAIVPNSVAGQEMLIARGLPHQKIRVIFNGINLDRLEVNESAVAVRRSELSKGDDVFVVGMLASLTRAKGHSTAIKAIAELRDRHPHVRLAIVGDGPLREELQSTVEDLNLTNHVTFYGYRRDISNFLAAFDVLVSASHDNEGTSNSILEAMALGIPVVATDIGGNREVVIPGETGRIVAPADSTSLTNALIQTFEEPDTTAQMTRRARSRVDSQYSLRHMISEYESLYRELISRPVQMVDADGKTVAVRV